MTVTYLPGDSVHDEQAQLNFEYIQSFGLFVSPTTGPVAVTGSRGGNVALASLLTQLAAIGAIIDGTVP